MIQASLQRGIIAVLLTPTPDSHEDILDDQAPLASIAKQIRRLGEQLGVPVVDSYSAFQHAVKQGRPVDSLLSQSNHPNRAGHEIVANLIGDLFLSLKGSSGAIAARPAVRGGSFDLVGVERLRVLAKADRYLDQPPRTVTADSCERSQGGRHDFYSEGDYWWPDPADPEGKYIRRDGQSNPENFIAHRESMMRFSEIVATLTCAYLVTGKESYARSAIKHLRAWMIDPQTRMNPSLLYGQAIKGRYSGRSIGVIDTIHLVEVARSVKHLGRSQSFSADEQAAVKGWFAEYLNWLNTHEYGLTEKVHPNNHGVCWSMQAAAFADLVGDQATLDWIRNQFKSVYVAEMMNDQGGFPAELARTKPYGYSLFVIDAMAGLAQIASTKQDSLWDFQLPDGRGMRRGLKFIAPFIQDKSRWPQPPDIQYWDDWPAKHISLILAAVNFGEADYWEMWSKLPSDSTNFEVLRNQPLRHPLLWVETKP
jgi:hypothetical protein